MTDLHMNPSLLPSERERYASLANDERWLAGYDAGRDATDDRELNESTRLETELGSAQEERDAANATIGLLHQFIDELASTFKDDLPATVAAALEGISNGGGVREAVDALRSAREQSNEG